MERGDELLEQTLYRDFALDNTRIDEEARTVHASLSSEQEVERWFGREVLLHKPENINLDRAAGNGLPLLWSHKAEDSLGKVRDIRVEGGRLVGELHFSKNARANDIWNDVRDGFLDAMSIGYRINKWSESEDSDLVEATLWSLLEASVVTVPADNTVGINRSLEEIEPLIEGSRMDKEDGNLSVIDISSAEKRGAEEEAARRSALDTVFDDYLNIEGVNTLRKQAVSEGWDAARAAVALNKLIIGAKRLEIVQPANVAEPVAAHSIETDSVTPRIAVGVEALEKFNEAATDAIMLRGKVIFDEDGKTDRKRELAIRADNPYTNHTLIDIVREYSDLARLNVKGVPLEKQIGMAMSHRAGGMANADLPALMENIMGKMMMVPLSPADENWRDLVRISSLNDFKQTSRVNLGSASDLEEISNGGSIPRGYISDFKEYLKARTFGVELAVEYQTLRNDDVNALTGLPLEIRRKGNRKVGDLVWAILTGNPDLVATGTAVFLAGQGNLITSGAAPGVTTLDAAIAWLGTQKAPSPTGDETNDPGDYLNIEPAFLCVPKQLEARARVLMASQYDPDAASGSQLVNTVQGRMQVVSEARLSAFNANGWFVLGSPSQHPTIEVGFVDGQETPMVQQEDDWNTRGVKFAVWHDFDVKAMDYRGMYYNDGVT